MTHVINWLDPDGNPLTILRSFRRLEYMRAEGKVGWMTLDLDPGQIDTNLLRVNMRLEPWRSTQTIAPYLDGESAFWLQTWGWQMDAQGAEVIHLEALDNNCFLDGHNIAEYAGNANAEKTDEADDMMKAIIREQMGALATNTARDLSAWLTVQANLTAAPSITKGFSRRQVLDVLGEIMAESYKNGTYLTFDIARTGQKTMEFRTYTGQRGVDHGQASAQPVIISRLRHNLEQPEYTEDHSDEANYIYAGGQGTDADRVIKTANTADAVGLNRREKFVYATNLTDAVAVQGAADAALYQYRAKRTLTGKVVDTDGCQYGLHYRYGDLVYAEYKAGFDCHINAIQLTVENGAETLDIHVRGEA